jgi:hypothetical protein
MVLMSILQGGNDRAVLSPNSLAAKSRMALWIHIKLLLLQKELVIPYFS